MYLGDLLFADMTILASLGRLQALGAWISIRWLNQENERIFLLS
ncbi:hypothetical protein SynMVIR181_02101 [Synechococcus sp. MVIR-18-1]|nr:hypothetical protein SynMVIR181_02101 [Synechococcus sp. MVIR-18-1]